MENYDYKSMGDKELSALVIDQSEETTHRETAFQELLDQGVGVEQISTDDLSKLVEEDELTSRFLCVVENAFDHREQ
jgi:hypothetical protein